MMEQLKRYQARCLINGYVLGESDNKQETISAGESHKKASGHNYEIIDADAEEKRPDRR